jgi:hypothetical protein
LPATSVRKIGLEGLLLREKQRTLTIREVSDTTGDEVTDLVDVVVRLEPVLGPLRFNLQLWPTRPCRRSRHEVPRPLPALCGLVGDALIREPEAP